MKLINGDMVIQDLTPKSTNIGVYAPLNCFLVVGTLN